MLQPYIESEHSLIMNKSQETTVARNMKLRPEVKTSNFILYTGKSLLRA